MKAILDFGKMSPPKAVTLVFVASILLVVVSYGIWQFGQLLSPIGNFNTGGNPTVVLSISDYDKFFIALPNVLSNTTSPLFEDNQTRPTLLSFDINTNKLKMARLEIRLDYR